MIIHANSDVATTKYPMRSPNTADTSRYTLPMNSTTAQIVTRRPLTNVGASASRATWVIVSVSLDRVDADVVLGAAGYRLLDRQDVVHDRVDLVVVERPGVLHAPGGHVGAGTPL